MKPYKICRMISLSMTLSDRDPDFKVRHFSTLNIVKTYRQNYYAQEETIPNIWHCTMFGDLD